MKLTLWESLTVNLLWDKLDYEELYTLGRWLQCIQYVKPKDRKIIPKLSEFISHHHVNGIFATTSSKHAFGVYLLVNTVETSLTQDSQERISSWMNLN